MIVNCGLKKKSIPNAQRSFAFNGQMGSKAHTAPIVPFGFTSYYDWQMRSEKFGVDRQLRNQLFLIVIHHHVQVRVVDRIRINLSCWIWIWIHILNVDPDPGEQKWPTNIEKSKEFSCFEVLEALFWGLKAFIET